MRIMWDTGPRPYSQGVNHGVLYPASGPGVAWNGLITVSETGVQSQSALYYDGVRYLSRGQSAPFAGSISAFTYPDELEDYIGTKDFFTAQGNRPFGFSYATNEEIHLVYEVLLAPSPRAYSSIGSRVDPVPFQWNFTTQPQKIPGGKSSAHIVILLDEIDPDNFAAIEAMIYGDDENDPHLPSIEELITIYEGLVTLLITEYPDGTWSADGPDAYVSDPSGGTFTIDSPSLAPIDSTIYNVSNY